MKIAALITVAALATGGAFAAQNTSSYDKATSHSAATADDSQAKPGIVERTKDAIRRMGEKLGHATERMTGKHSDQAATDSSRGDTRAMGAAGSDDSGRQRRMDNAYNNWNSKQK